MLPLELSLLVRQVDSISIVSDNARSPVISATLSKKISSCFEGVKKEKVVQLSKRPTSPRKLVRGNTFPAPSPPARQSRWMSSPDMQRRKLPNLDRDRPMVPPLTISAKRRVTANMEPAADRSNMNAEANPLRRRVSKPDTIPGAPSLKKDSCMDLTLRKPERRGSIDKGDQILSTNMSLLSQTTRLVPPSRTKAVSGKMDLDISSKFTANAASTVQLLDEALTLMSDLLVEGDGMERLSLGEVRSAAPAQTRSTPFAI